MSSLTLSLPTLVCLAPTYLTHRIGLDFLPSPHEFRNCETKSPEQTTYCTTMPDVLLIYGHDRTMVYLQNVVQRCTLQFVCVCVGSRRDGGRGNEGRGETVGEEEVKALGGRGGG